MAFLHLHAPKVNRKTIAITVCLDCKQRTRMLMFWYEYYDVESTCIKCGRRWSGGEWMPLYFIRQSRKKSIDAAKRLWRSIK